MYVDGGKTREITVKIAFIIEKCQQCDAVVEDIWVDDASISKEARVSAYDTESMGTRVGAGECCVVIL
jgi:hypothetical protein